VRTVILPYFHYGYAHADLLWKVFLQGAESWAGNVDRIYVVDSGPTGLQVPSTFSLRNVEIVQKPSQSHWANLNQAVAANEGNLLIMDMDTIIYDNAAVVKGFEALESGYDFASILDGSGGVDLTNYDLMKANENREERRRFAPYFMFLNKKALRPSFNFTPGTGAPWTDSVGYVTIDALKDEKKIFELQDDRATISLEDNGTITSMQWLDTAPKLWALDEHPNLGYYHVRNFGEALRILHNKSFGLVPGREARRLLAWAVTLSNVVGEPIDIPVELYEHVLGGERWDKYLDRFAQYHAWLGDY
jgi:hypothetical protein